MIRATVRSGGVKWELTHLNERECIHNDVMYVARRKPGEQVWRVQSESGDSIDGVPLAELTRAVLRLDSRGATVPPPAKA